MQSDKIDQLVIALIKVQQNLKLAEKNRVNPHFKSPYADLESIWKTCRQLLGENGLAVIQTTDFHDGTAVLVTSLCHVSGQWISGEYPLNPEKPTPQSLGSAMTYARRYSLEAILGIVSSKDPDDDDAEGAMDRANNTPPRPTTTKPQVPKAQAIQKENYSNKELLEEFPLPTSIGAIAKGTEPPWPEFEQVEKKYEPNNDYAIGDYVIKFGKKYYGKTLNDVGPEQLLSYMNYIQSESKKSGKDLSEGAREFIKEVNLYLACKQKEDEDDSVPF